MFWCVIEYNKSKKKSKVWLFKVYLNASMNNDIDLRML